MLVDTKDVIFQHVDAYGVDYFYEQSMIPGVPYDGEEAGVHDGASRGKGMWVDI